MPTKPQSILFVITRGDSIGGAQIHVRDLAAGAARHGRRVAVAVGSEGPFVGLLRSAGLEVFLVPGLGRAIDPFSDLKAVGKLRALLRRWKPDLVACHTAKAGLVGRLAALWAGIPAQYTVHGWQFAQGISFIQRLLVLMVETALASVTQTIITVSESDRQMALWYRVARPGRIVTVHNGMPLLPPAPAATGLSEIRLIMVARFQPQKDHETLFAALEVLDDLPWSLHLVGDGPHLGRWVSWVNQRGWRARVVFHGLSHEVPALLAASDIFVLASRWEGFPNTILEAMRSGLPVVASDVGGVSEAVEEGRTGFLVPAEDPAALAAALGRLMGDLALRRELGACGRQRFEAEFTFDRMLEKTERVWDRR
jgi:glycosyltransferase involved in cell wall biosynthesis